MKKIRTIALAGALPLALALGACSAPGALDSGDDDASGEKTTLTYSKSQGPYTELFEDAVAPILEEQGYTLQSQDVSDLLTADIALNDGDVDFNVEQHTAYLEAFNAENDGDLTPITPIPTVPAGIYSEHHDSLDDVTDGATVAVPNDASNMARAYLLLELLIQGAPKAEIDRRVDEVLKIVELEDKRNASIRQLSGGQKQRVGIARALTTQPSILLCDEATSALDPKTTESILALLKRINREMGVTILLITHQMHVIQRICNKVAVMEAGRIVEQGSVIDVFTQPRQPITQEFVRTVVNDQIPEPMREMVQAETRPQELLRLRFVGDTVRQPLLSSLSRIEGLEVNILGATVEELQESVICLFLVQLIGDDEPVRRAERLIDDAGILRERIEA